MKHYCPTGRRNRGRPLKRLLDTWDRNGSTGGLTAWQIYGDDDDDDDYDDDDDNRVPQLEKKKYSHDSVKLHILNSTLLVVVRLPSLLNVRLMAAEFRNLQKK